MGSKQSKCKVMASPIPVVIASLDEEQLGALSGVQKGDLLELAIFMRATDSAQASESDGEGDHVRSTHSHIWCGLETRADVTQDPDAGSQEDSGDAEAEDEGGSDNEDGEKNDEYFDDGEDGGDDADAQSDHSEAAEYGQELEREVYVVSDITTQTSKLGNTEVVDIKLLHLTYQALGESRDPGTYRIYAKAIDVCSPAATVAASETPTAAESLADIVFNTENLYMLKLKPNGDDLRSSVFNGVCPGGCHDGWLDDQHALCAVLNTTPQTLQHFRPLCPVCIGLPLLREQMTLRKTLDDFTIVDFGDVHNYLAKLNPRRCKLGYRYIQLDEREWGYYFEDMVDEDGSDDGGGANGNGDFQYFDEAMDPSTLR